MQVPFAMDAAIVAHSLPGEPWQKLHVHSVCAWDMCQPPPPGSGKVCATTLGSGLQHRRKALGDADAHTVHCAGVDADRLCMDASLISDILQCRITSWSHRNISALNPGIR